MENNTADIPKPIVSISKLENLRSDVSRLARRLLDACSAAGVQIKITSGFRSWKDQDKLYRKGRDAPGKKVTNARGGHSWHNFARAFDVAFIVHGRISWEGPWEMVGRIGEQLGLEWGGRWHSFRDECHFQLTGGMTLAQARKAYQVQQDADEEMRHKDAKEAKHANKVALALKEKVK